MVNNPYLKYQKTQVETADKGTLLLMLYDGAIRFMVKAKEKMDGGDLREAFAYLVRADRIVKELIASLDMEKGGEVASNLFRLYEFVLWKILLAERERKTHHIDEAMHIIEELRNAWKEAIKREKEAEDSKQVDVRSKGEERVSVRVVG